MLRRLFTVLSALLLCAAVVVTFLAVRHRAPLAGSKMQVVQAPVLSDPEMRGRTLIVAPGLVRRDDPSLSAEARRVIRAVEGEYQVESDSDVLYSVGEGRREDGSMSGLWTVMFYPVSGYSRSGSPLSEGVKMATVFPDGTIMKLEPTRSFAGPVIISRSPLSVTTLPSSNNLD